MTKDGRDTLFPLLYVNKQTDTLISLPHTLLAINKSWWLKLKEYAILKKNYSNWEEFATKKDFDILLSDFLFCPYGFDFRAFFKFDRSLECGQPVPTIKV